ncbi:hypothetical protein V6N11_059420 [Hibiscus sabdariffa]|uniref:Longin domain-containing protein n=1 Tax=Hibiscus sabdariffa TaxID=183260 RepID=A0ABR2AEZ0_9ROSI
MGQQSLIYAFVARGTVVLADYTEFTGNFTGIASQCLQKLPASNNKFTYNCDGHTFNYLVDNGFTYCVVAIESVGRQVPMAFLERIKEDFTKRYGGGKAAAAPAQSLSKEFGPKLKEHMQYCIDHPEEISKIAKVKAQVSEVKGVMMENIEKAQDFRQQGTQMRRKMWLQNMKIKLIVLGILIALILIIDYGHRVRLATHSNFKEFVLTAGLEFYPLGGDPKVLAGYISSMLEKLLKFINSNRILDHNLC